MDNAFKSIIPKEDKTACAVELITNGYSLSSVKITIKNNNDASIISVDELNVTSDAGVYATASINSSAMVKALTDELFIVTFLKQPCNGSHLGVVVNMKKILECENFFPKSEMVCWSKYICISKQAEDLAVLRYAKEINVDAFIPEPNNKCRSCAHKKYCYYRASTKNSTGTAMSAIMPVTPAIAPVTPDITSVSQLY